MKWPRGKIIWGGVEAPSFSGCEQWGAGEDYGMPLRTQGCGAIPGEVRKTRNPEKTTSLYQVNLLRKTTQGGAAQRGVCDPCEPTGPNLTSGNRHGITSRGAGSVTSKVGGWDLAPTVRATSPAPTPRRTTKQFTGMGLSRKTR